VLAIILVIAFARGEPVLLALPTHAKTAAAGIATAVLIGAVFAALHYAEIVGARLGEPLGTLALTINVLTGLVHLVVFATFIFLLIAP
jgi:Ca2+:H+ antiporter